MNFFCNRILFVHIFWAPSGLSLMLGFRSWFRKADADANFSWDLNSNGMAVELGVALGSVNMFMFLMANLLFVTFFLMNNVIGKSTRWTLDVDVVLMCGHCQGQT